MYYGMWIIPLWKAKISGPAEMESIFVDPHLHPMHPVLIFTDMDPCQFGIDPKRIIPSLFSPNLIMRLRKICDSLNFLCANGQLWWQGLTTFIFIWLIHFNLKSINLISYNYNDQRNISTFAVWNIHVFNLIRHSKINKSVSYKNTTPTKNDTKDLWQWVPMF